jgi:uncharacterized protein (DUF58 family)
MIVPRPKLIGWTALIVLPFGTLAALAPQAEAGALSLIALFFAGVLLDWALSLGVLDGIGVVLPDVARLSKDRAGVIEIQVVNDKCKPRLLRLGLPLPRELPSPQEDQWVLLPGGAPRARFSWPLTPVQRGRYLLHECRLETASLLGFWAVRRAAAAKGEVRVYPNLLTERKSVAAVFLNRGLFGIHAQRQIGKGRDFEKLREYLPGDSVQDVHWKATAKRVRPMTKVFQVERTQEVYVIIDSSRLSARSQAGRESLPGRGEAMAGLEPPKTENRAVLERFITAGLVLGLAAEKQGDLFGLLTFSDRVENFVRARNGQTHFNACRDAIYRLQPRQVSPDYDEVCSFIRLRLRRRALLVFLTSLDDPVLAESFVRNMDLICRQHLILVNMILAPEARMLFSNHPVAAVDDLYCELGGHLLWNNLRELGKVLRRRGVGFAMTANEGFTAELVTQYLSVKRRQAL